MNAAPDCPTCPRRRVVGLGPAATLLALLLAGCGSGDGGGPAAVTPSPQPAVAVALDSASFDALVLANPRPSLVEFWHPGCSACQSMVPVVDRLAADFHGRALVGTVDVDTQRALAQAYAVTVVPTFVFFKDGHEVSRQWGTTRYEDLAARLEALLDPS